VDLNQIMMEIEFNLICKEESQVQNQNIEGNLIIKVARDLSTSFQGKKIENHMLQTCAWRMPYSHKTFFKS